MSDPIGGFDVQVGDGGLLVSADELARYGIRPGDTVRIQPLSKPRRVSLLGFRAGNFDFTQDNLSQLRREMGEGLGEDLTR